MLELLQKLLKDSRFFSIGTSLRFFNITMAFSLCYLSALTINSALAYYLETLTPQDKTLNLEQASNEPLAKARRNFSEYQIIFDKNAFRAKRGPARATDQVQQTPVEEVEETTMVAEQTAPEELPLPIKLTGIVSMGSYFMISVVNDSNGSEEVYLAYECIPHSEDTPTTNCSPEQGQLVDVANNQAIILMYDKRYRLGFTDVGLDILKNTANADVASVSPNAIIRRETPKAPPTETGGSEPFPTSGTPDNLTIRVPDTEVKKAFENFSEVLSQARVEPNVVNGEQSGFVFTIIQPQSIFARMSLQPGDVIDSLNGESINTADKALELFTTFRNARNINLKVLRDNQPVALNYVIE